MANAKTAKTVETETTANNTENVNVASEFEIDPSIMGEEFNCKRERRFPYGIVINDAEAGLFIPEKNLSKAGWVGDYKDLLVEKDLSGGKEKGIFFSNPRMIILGKMPAYLKYKSDKEKTGELANTFIGWYDGYEGEIDKEKMDAVSDHAVLFVDTANNFLHEIPIRIRFKNVALWSLWEALESLYTEAELSFARRAGTVPSGKNDMWRSLIVLDLTMQGIKEGSGNNKSYCCKTVDYVHADDFNFPSLFLGTKQKMLVAREKMSLVEGFNNTVKALIGAASSNLALPAASEDYED
ncbi:MAG TPA: DUF5895 domain-containing protein [Nostocaceae cyanobacterium]|nr:DUF5895 domain-containing protein [Nostocaceae cyanobacterium]